MPGPHIFDSEIHMIGIDAGRSESEEKESGKRLPYDFAKACSGHYLYYSNCM